MKERRGNVLDLFLILLLAFSLVSVLGRFGESRDAFGESVEGTVTVRVERSDAMLSECLDIGESLYLSTGEYYGELIDIERLPARVTLLEDGVFYVGEYGEEGPWEYLASVRVAGEVRENVFYRSERDALLSGRTVTLWGARTVIRGTIVETPR